MKIEKNKIVFVAIILCVLLFIGSYAVIHFSEDEAATIESNQIPIPALKDEQKQYDSKLEALNDLIEVRETNAPSIYDERLLDSTGVYDPDLLSKEKMRIVDSIYNQGRINYSDKSYRKNAADLPEKIIIKDTIGILKTAKTVIENKQLALEHQLFFASDPKSNQSLNIQNSDSEIYVVVNGAQTVKKNYRLKMRLINDAIISGNSIRKNTEIYGFVSFKPNRAIIAITNINHQPFKLKAYDLQDGSEGIYIENSFQDEARQEVVGDVIDDINISGVPQITGIKKIFQRNNKNVKVTIADNYKLILKPLKETN
ncbi:conjugative transposon protein TraM [Lutibacter sp. A64]|uniref:conjugative transposon protein TraM n=1 Tax=Lutibacter sp. A64 TaxID=2918526 RepID=UPI001F055690|nr:conjugative transposon protein TraM [Lutibacter sp. A64]UMB54233.1 conjugative transposon protein TraM [Lutibacter sp. A64]